MPSEPVDVIWSGPAVELDILSEAAWASVNKSRTRAPSPSDATDDGDWLPPPFLSSTAISCGRTSCIAMYSSNSSASVLVPRFRTGVAASVGAVPSWTTASATPDAPGASLPDTSAAAPGAMSIVTASPAFMAAAVATTSLAFWPCVSATVTVSFTVSMPCAPSSRMRSDPAATVIRPASSPPSGADTYSSYTMSSLPAPRSKAVRFPPASGRAGMGAVASAFTSISLLVEPKYRPAPLENDPGGTLSFASVPASPAAATAAAFCAAVKFMTTVALNSFNGNGRIIGMGAGTWTAALSSGTDTPLPFMVAPARLVSVSRAHSLNSTSSTPVFRSKRTASILMEGARLWLLCSGAPSLPPGGPSSISPLWPGGRGSGGMPSAPRGLGGDCGGRPGSAAAVRGLPEPVPLEPDGAPVSTPPNGTPDTSYTADPDTPTYMVGSECIATSVRARWNGVIVTTMPVSLAPAPPPPPDPCADTDAPASDTFPPAMLYTHIWPGTAVPTPTYSSNDIETVPAVASSVGPDSSTGGVVSITVSSAALCRPAKLRWCASVSEVGETDTVRYPPVERAAAASAFCAAVSEIARFVGGVPVRLMPAPASATGAVPLPPIEMPARVVGSLTPLLNPISRTPELRSRLGPRTTCSGPVSLAAVTSAPITPANRLPDRSANAVFGTVRSRWPSSWYACLADAAAAAGRSSTAKLPDHPAAAEAPARDIDVPLLVVAASPDGLKAVLSTYSSNRMLIVPLPRTGSVPSAIDGAVRSYVTGIPQPGSGRYHPRLPAG